MTDYVTPSGLVIPAVTDLQKSISDSCRAGIDPLLNTDPDDPLGQVIGIFASRLREAYEVGQIAYNAFNPDAAEGFLLEATSALTGTKRQAAGGRWPSDEQQSDDAQQTGTHVPKGSQVRRDLAHRISPSRTAR